MLAALAHLTSIELDLDFVGTIGPRQNNVANDASFRHEENCEFLLRWAYLESLLPVIAGKKSRLSGHQHGGTIDPGVLKLRCFRRANVWATGKSGSHFAFPSWECEFKMASIVCHCGKAVVRREYKRTANWFMRRAVHDRASEVVCVFDAGWAALRG